MRWLDKVFPPQPFSAETEDPNIYLFPALYRLVTAERRVKKYDFRHSVAGDFIVHVKAPGHLGFAKPDADGKPGWVFFAASPLITAVRLDDHFLSVLIDGDTHLVQPHIEKMLRVDPHAQARKAAKAASNAGKSAAGTGSGIGFGYVGYMNTAGKEMRWAAELKAQLANTWRALFGELPQSPGSIIEPIRPLN
jgi:hypothetical protein